MKDEDSRKKCKRNWAKYIYFSGVNDPSFKRRPMFIFLGVIISGFVIIMMILLLYLKLRQDQCSELHATSIVNTGPIMSQSLTFILQATHDNLSSLLDFVEASAKNAADRKTAEVFSRMADSSYISHIINLLSLYRFVDQSKSCMRESIGIQPLFLERVELVDMCSEQEWGIWNNYCGDFEYFGIK